MSTCASTASRNTSEHMWSPCADASHPRTPQHESFTTILQDWFINWLQCFTDNSMRAPAVKRLNVTDCLCTDVLKYPMQLIPFLLIKRALEDVISEKKTNPIICCDGLPLCGTRAARGGASSAARDGLNHQSSRENRCYWSNCLIAISPSFMSFLLLISGLFLYVSLHICVKLL